MQRSEIIAQYFRNVSIADNVSSLLQFRRDLKTALHVSDIVLFTIVFGCVTDCNFYYCKLPL